MMAGPQHDPVVTTTRGDVGEKLMAVLQHFNRTADQLLRKVEDRVTVPGVDDTLRVSPHEQLRELRATMPRRPLQINEAKRIAERQAALLRWQLSQAAAPAIPTEVLTALSFLTVEFRDGLVKSALATKTGRGWVIVLRSDEPLVRQRFSLAHEIKHLLDDEPMGDHDGRLYLPSRLHSSQHQAEHVCDHFAACLLMPKILVRRDWTSGIQDPSRLARRYQVSKIALEIRLRELGLAEPTKRCRTAGWPGRG
jgi:Zn-dependent peptidase ImmA (M78 family)